MRSHTDEHFGGMTDMDERGERRAIDLLSKVKAALTGKPPAYRSLAITALRVAANDTDLRRDCIVDFAEALADEGLSIEAAIHDYAPNIDQWEEDIRAAGRAQ